MVAVIWISIVSLQVRFCYHDIVNFRHIRRFLKISLTPGQRIHPADKRYEPTIPTSALLITIVTSAGDRAGGMSQQQACSKVSVLTQPR